MSGIACLGFVTPAWEALAASTPAHVLAAVGIVLAGVVKGATGMGFPTLGAPIAALFLDPQTTVVVITIPAFGMNLLQACQGGVSRALVRRLLPVLVVLVPSAMAGTVVLARVSGRLLLCLLGLIITVYALAALGHLRLVLSPAHERWVGILTGLCSGVIGGATSIFAPPVVMYLTALDLPKEAFVATTALCLLVGQLPHLVSLVSLRLLTWPRLGLAALFCGLSACGFMLGVRLQRRISQQRFAKVVLVTLLLVGLSLVHAGVRRRP
jgi:uncharacterized membrane protein YfcA